MTGHERQQLREAISDARRERTITTRQRAKLERDDQVRRARAHAGLWLRIRGNCIEAASTFDLDAHAAAIVLTIVKAKASGVLA